MSILASVTQPQNALDRFFDGAGKAGLLINGMHTQRATTLVADPSLTENEIATCQAFVDAFDWSAEAQAAWEALQPAPDPAL